MTAINRDVYYRFYAAELSYFSAKVRPALRYKRIPFLELMPTTQAYREVIIPRTGVRFIPIIITDDDVAIQDTSTILDELERRFPIHRCIPARHSSASSRCCGSCTPTSS